MGVIEDILRRYEETAKGIERASGDCAALNLKRIFYGSVAMLPLSSAAILVFMFSEYQTTEEFIWHAGIITVHFASLFVMGAAAIISGFFMRRNIKGFRVRLLHYALFAATMCGGILITAFGLLVSPGNITCFVLACVATGAVFVTRPLHSAVIYFVSCAAFFFAVSIPLDVYNALMSARINGFAAAALGFLISVITWRGAYSNIIKSKQIETQRKSLQKAAFLDPLTGLHNRRYFDRLVSEEISAQRENGAPSCLIMLDIDNFKDVNDKYGHPNGDRVLVGISGLLKKNVRKNDSVCRFGGEEFILLLPEISLPDAANAAEKLRRVVEESVFRIEGHDIKITASFGVARLDRSADPALISQYSVVDKALYTAKQNGRNRVVATQAPS